MIDPSSIMEVIPANKETTLKLGYVEECDYEIYDIYDDKDFKKYISDIEHDVRSSIEYKEFINYIRSYMDMNECAFLEDVKMDGSFKVKIEQHHYPFTLYDIVLIVFNKRLYYGEAISIYDVSKEVMSLHYKLMVGLISLSTTVHQLNHNKYLFIPLDKVLGRWNLFVDSYKEFMLPEQIDVLTRIEDYTNNSHLYSNTNNVVLRESKTYLDVDGTYKLPDFSTLVASMSNRIREIKSNGYRLPTIEDKKAEEEHKTTNKQLSPAIYFY